MRVEFLEPRVLFSAELTAISPDDSSFEPSELRLLTETAPHATAEADTDSTDIQALGRELIVIDSRVPEAESLIESLRTSRSSRYFDILVVYESESGLEQLAQFIDGHEPWQAWHIFSHASPGALQLGSDTVTQDHLERAPNQFSSWAEALTGSADILLYGCDLAATEQGLAFIDTLATLTGADVAASDDPTGASAFGGDFTLEVQTGSIETSIALDAQAQAQFAGTLATYTVTNTNDSGAGSFRQAILNANGNFGTDSIVFSIAGTGIHTITPL
ncbi:MAG: DUF4347 domain-containing protein, partial [Candidatus Eremiobacteraeota bacterium]|nr:DUF4347 domain-containing protein [Candidatus Eremiobacteraeota bacterium]